MAGFGFSAQSDTSHTDAKSMGSGSEKVNTRRLSVEDEEFTKELLRSFGANTNVDLAGARKQAIEDTQSSIAALFTQFKDTALPQIAGAEKRTGGYNTTTGEQLTNDAFARTLSQAAGLQLNAVNQYETAALNKSQQALSGFSTSLQALLQANEQQNTDSMFTTRSTSTTTAHKIAAKFGA